MTENEKQELIYLAMKDIFKEFNHAVNHLVILREFLKDVYNCSENEKKLEFDYPSISKCKKINNY